MNQDSVSRRQFLRSTAALALFGSIVALPVGCGGGNAKNTGNTGGDNNSGGTGDAGTDTPKLPENVKYVPDNKHTPRCTVTDGDQLKIEVTVPHVVKPDHYIKGVKFVGPGPEFKEVDSFELTDEQIAAANLESWDHTYMIDKAKIPAGAAYLIAISFCNTHGEYGTSAKV